MIMNMTAPSQPGTTYVTTNGYKSTEASMSYDAMEKKTITVPFKPKMVYGWGQFASGTKRTVCGGGSSSGSYSCYEAASDGTYNDKMYTFTDNSVTFIPNGTRGTCYYFVAGTL